MSLTSRTLFTSRTHLADPIRFAGRIALPITFLVLALTLSSGVCLADPKPALVIEKIEEDSDFLTVTFDAQGLFSPRIIETLARGLPATLSYEIQLWKERRMWLDRLVQSNSFTYRIRYDPWEDGYRIQTRIGSSPAVLDIEHVERSLCTRVRTIVGSVSTIDQTATYYIVIRATMRPVSPEDVDRVESWLSDGKPQGKRGITAVPGYLFDVIVGLSGLGDESVSVKSQPFLPADFFPH